jgi:TRAP-type mannitol/chloroaromatic compound transport system permease small subunit
MGSSGGGIGRAFDALVSGINAVGTVWIFVLMVLINSDVFMRFLFNAPVMGVPLIISMSIIGIVFLQLPDALRNGRFIRNDGLIAVLLERRPNLGQTLEAIYNFAGFLFMAVLVWYEWPFLVKNWVSKTYAGNEGDFILPVWPLTLMVVIGSVCCGIQYLRHMCRNIRYLSGDKSAAEHIRAGEETEL